MVGYRDTIIRKYRRISRLPDSLFAFTFPLRRHAVQWVQLQPGARVLEVDCSIGANFALLVDVVGKQGEITAEACCVLKIDTDLRQPSSGCVRKGVS